MSAYQRYKRDQRLWRDANGNLVHIGQESPEEWDAQLEAEKQRDIEFSERCRKTSEVLTQSRSL